MNVRSAIKLSLITQILSKIITFVCVIITARLLTPEELGVFAIVSSITILAVDLRFFGTGHYLIKEKEVTEQKKRSVLGVSIVISFILGVFLFLSSDKLARFFGYSDMSLLFKLMSLSFFIAPFYVVPNALMTKEYDFKNLMIITCLSQLVSVVLTVYLIFIGFSYFSLAVTMNVAIVIQLLITFFLVPKHLLFRPSFKNIADILNFGSISSLSIILTRLSYVAPDLIIGKLGTTREVAMYSRGLGFIDFLSQVLTMGFKPIALPYLSDSIHNNMNVKNSYLRATNLLGSISWPVIGVASIAAYPIIVLLFGDQWLEAVPLVSYLGIWMMFKMIHIFSPAIFIASNKYKLLLYHSLSVFILTTLTILFTYEGGLVAIAQAMALVGVFEFVLVSILLRVHYSLGIIELLKSLFPNIILTLTAAGITFLLHFSLDFSSLKPIMSIILIASVNIPIWLLLTKLLKLEIFDELSRAISELKR